MRAKNHTYKYIFIYMLKNSYFGNGFKEAGIRDSFGLEGSTYYISLALSYYLQCYFIFPFDDPKFGRRLGCKFPFAQLEVGNPV